MVRVSNCKSANCDIYIKSVWSVQVFRTAANAELATEFAILLVHNSDCVLALQ